MPKKLNSSANPGKHTARLDYWRGPMQHTASGTAKPPTK